MINVNMTDKAGVTLATAGKYCADNVKVTPSAEILRKDEQAKTATPTTSAQDITPDAGKALSKVTVNPITAAIVGNLDASSFAASIVAAVEGKGVTVPSGTLLDGMASLIESIEAEGGGVRVEQGSVTFAEAQSSYTFVEDTPDIFIVYVEDDSKPVYSSSKFIWAMTQDTRLFDQHGRMVKTGYIFGYNIGIQKYYTPTKVGASGIGTFNSTDFNSKLGAKTYKWYAIYGVTAT